MKTATRLVCLALLLPVASCSDGFSDSDARRLTSQFYDYLQNKTFSANGERRCTEVYTLSPAKLVDRSATGNRGRLRISVNATFQGPYRYARFGVPIVHYPPCYGVPRGGLVPGQTATSTYDVQIEKWESGWRIIQPQTFEPIG